MQITYLLNSGFAVELEHTLLVFDAYDDPARALDAIVARRLFARVYFLASHSHFDQLQRRPVAALRGADESFHLVA